MAYDSVHHLVLDEQARTFVLEGMVMLELVVQH